MITPLKRFGLFCSLAILLCGCRVVRVITAERDCDPSLQEMLLDMSALPEGWSSAEPSQNNEYGRGGVEHCEISFYVLNGSAYEEIYRYGSETEAKQDYNYFMDIFFWEHSPNLPPPRIESKVADEFYVACAVLTDTPMCKVLARYGSFIVHFNTHLSPEFMTYSDLEAIINAIDDKMSSASLKGRLSKTDYF